MERRQDGGKRMGLNFDRVKYWLSVGVQPSEPVQRILFRAGLLPPPPMLAMGHKGGPRDTRQVDPLSGRFVNPAKSDVADQAGEEINAEDDRYDS
ncbi:PREDICTED: 30S ribosomal protein S16-2, chloroplastic/mitochondrial-like isoform X2 [Nelumbo nucifera]|uniref:30S ribosomal protein S16-2, chloroplastic/mitochondrial-like isoform X2 n=1 Tax=Nelumbo nucifera TaxID=4432 RepID=A0A1U8QC20_NELNU|nr:PREDICTED: 30S ribosomal protein S16-2, chloroplastic/mitochondrial-like isoform X2 [Nelumbo nucifera]